VRKTREAGFGSARDATCRLNRGENVGILAKIDAILHEIDPKPHLFAGLFCDQNATLRRRNQRASFRAESSFPIGSATVSSGTQSAHSGLLFIVLSCADTGHSWAGENA
jgi:hypothetical protein